MKPHESKNSKYIKILQEIYGSKYSYADLETLVWAGLHETAAFKELSDSKRNQIINTQKSVNEKCEKSCQ
ncbi:MAG TPA: hypothetical protein PK006_12710 [Saprospiraceae bacterium]|nr:hypothetical protein [Saprospiraceae bacterium]